MTNKLYKQIFVNLLAVVAFTQFSLDAMANKPCSPSGLTVDEKRVSDDPQSCGKQQLATKTPIISEILTALRKKADSLIDSSWVAEAGKDVTSGYYRWPATDGLLELYSATSELKYLNTAVEMGVAFIDSGSDTDSDGYLDWHSPYVPHLGYKNHWHYEWRAAAGIARTAATIAERADLNVVYKGELEKMLNYLERHVWEKWAPTGKLAYISSTDAVTTHFLGRLGSVAIGLHKATGETQYAEYIERKGAELVKSLELRADTNSYNITCTIYTSDCNYNPGGTLDVSHANDVINFIVEGYQEGYSFVSSQDIDRLVNTVTRVIWVNDGFAVYVNGSGGTGGIANNNGAWAKLSLYDDQLYRKYVDWALSPALNVSNFEKMKTLGSLARVTFERDNKGLLASQAQ